MRAQKVQIPGNRWGGTCGYYLLVTTITFMSLTGLRSSAQNQKHKRPNILVLISDDQRWDQVSCADVPIIPELKTPHIDRLARDGAYFRNAFVTTPICAVSRASIMTDRKSTRLNSSHYS